MLRRLGDLSADRADGDPAGRERRFDLALRRLRTATGSFGSFRVTVEGYRALDAVGRGPLGFGPAEARVESA